MGQFLVNFIINVVIIFLMKGKRVFQIYPEVRGMCPELPRSGSHGDVWARWSRGVVFNTTPNESVA